MDLYSTTEKKIKQLLALILPILLPFAVCTAFFFGVSRAGDETVRKEMISLENALTRGAVHTYAMTGAYPESLQELLNNYHIQYDSERFIVEYLPSGSNILPSVNVIVIPSRKGGGSS